MKLIGFIKEHDNLEEAQEYAIIQDSSFTNQELVEKVITYLNNGVLLFGWMGYCMDLEDGSLISPHSYYTDGYYVWPSYFPYYLKKHSNYMIDDEFLLYLSKNDFVFDEAKINADTKAKLEVKFSEKLDDL